MRLWAVPRLWQRYEHVQLFGMDVKLRHLHAQVEREYNLLPSESVCILADSIFVATTDVLTPFDYGTLRVPLPAGVAAQMAQERQRQRFFNLVHSQSRIAV